MTDTMLSLIGTAFPLTERSAEEYAKANVAGMDFSVRCFDAAGLGNVSLMHGELPKGAPFVMAMDTIVIIGRVAFGGNIHVKDGMGDTS